MDNLSSLLSDTNKVVQALPVVINAVSQVQGDLTAAQHASVVTQAANVLAIAANSAQMLGDKGLIGHNDASTVEQGAVLGTEGLSLFAEIEALGEKLKALAARIL